MWTLVLHWYASYLIPSYISVTLHINIVSILPFSVVFEMVQWNPNLSHFIHQYLHLNQLWQPIFILVFRVYKLYLNTKFSLQIEMNLFSSLLEPRHDNKVQCCQLYSLGIRTSLFSQRMWQVIKYWFFFFECL